MSDLYLKVKAIRLLRHLSQEATAKHSNINIKSYQRKESGNSPISDQELEQLSVPFQCSVDEIRNFDLENNNFFHPEGERVRELEVENHHLKSEVSYLRQLLEKIIDGFSGSPKSVGGGQNEL